jgi:hypothetical protein
LNLALTSSLNSTHKLKAGKGVLVSSSGFPFNTSSGIGFIPPGNIFGNFF